MNSSATEVTPLAHIKRLRAVRRATGIPQRDVARLAAVHETLLSAFENGRRRPTAAVIERVRRALIASIPAARAKLDHTRATFDAAVSELLEDDR